MGKKAGFKLEQGEESPQRILVSHRPVVLTQAPKETVVFCAEIEYDGRRDKCLPGHLGDGVRKTAAQVGWQSATYEEIKAVYAKYYSREKFVRVLGRGVCPETKWVEGSNYANVSFVNDERTGRIIMMGRRIIW